MDEVAKMILEIHSEILKSEGLDQKSNLDMEISRENGLNSLTIVTMIIAIEEMLNIDLDDVLPQIRRSKKLKELAEIVSTVVNSCD